MTAGTAKCAVKEVVKAAADHGAKDKVLVDVVGLGMGKKGQVAYSNLVKKSEGALIQIDNPGDVDSLYPLIVNVSKLDLWRRLKSG